MDAAYYIPIVSALIAAGSLWFTCKQWQQIKRKIVMVQESGRAAEILPAWYTERMMTDHWLFGLATADGRVLVITSIASVSDDGKWMDVELAEKGAWMLDEDDPKYVFAKHADRRKASVQISQIVMAYELATS